VPGGAVTHSLKETIMQINMEKVNRIASHPMSLKIFATLTQQEIFDYGVANLIKQGTLAYDADKNRCYYTLIRYGECLHCFAGFFIGDAYNKSMDIGVWGKSWASLINEKQVPATHKNFMNRMQESHDDLAQEVEDINEQTIAKWFKEVAVEVELEWYFDTDDDGNVTGGGYY
jgi:hypothetical protein